MTNMIGSLDISLCVLSGGAIVTYLFISGGVYFDLLLGPTVLLEARNLWNGFGCSFGSINH